MRQFIRFALALLFLAGFSRSLPAQSVRREYWLGISGSSITDLLNAPAYPNTPTAVNFPTSFEAPVNWADQYGTRMRGYVTAPTTGAYYFWIASDDQSQLFLSTDETAANKRLIANVNSWTNSREWTKEANQRSAAITLQAGQRYYLEAIQKEGGGGDNLAVGWQLPGGALERPIPGSRLAPYQNSTNPPAITAEPVDLNLEEGQQATFRVSATGMEPLFFQWQRDGADIVAENSPTLVLIRATQADDGARFRCVVSNALGSALSREATLQVHPETVAPVVATVGPPANSIVRWLSEVEIHFSEAVTGIDAGDLLVNGQPATSLTGIGAGPYLFEFPALTNGTAQLGWALGHGITDLTEPPNPFAGTNVWTFYVNPAAPVANVQINEIVAANISGLADEDGEVEDWIEIVNRSAFAVSLQGWSLTDNPDQPGQWTFPAIGLTPGQHLVVFASGKDRKPTAPGSRLHTNFKLNVGGEYLGLFNHESPRQAISELAPEFPVQRNDYAYGRDSSNQWRYFRTPTPGAPNGNSAISETLGPPHFSVQRGYFNQPFNLILAAANAGAEIRYTTNGSEPTETNGVVYTAPIPITRTTVLRAAVFKTNALPSEVVTHTYLYGLSTAFRSIPAMSVVTATNNLLGPTGIIGIKGGTYANGPWQPVNPGDYHNPSKHGIAWERPASAEYIRPQDNSGFQIDCGIRVQGSDWLRPRYTPGSKFSYRLYFRSDYGDSDLEYALFTNAVLQSFDQIVLRAGHNDEVNPFVKDELVRRLHLDMGQVASHGTFNTYYLNGVYKGYYNAVERIDKNFCQAWHGGTNAWDVIAQFNDPLDGDLVQWNAMRSFINSQDLAQPGNYAEAGRRLDLTNFVDYLLVNIYAATKDWPGNNWRAARQRVPGGRFRFYIWDAEVSFGAWISGPAHNVFTDQLNENGEIATLYKALRKSPEFRLLFADRVHQHMFNGGALVNTNVTARFTQLRLIMQSLISGFDSYIASTWVPQRRSPLLSQLAGVGLLASSNAPTFNQHGGRVPVGFNLSMTASNGVIYFTTNGVDPRVPFSGAVAGAADTYAGPIPLNTSATIKARSLAGTNWSALTEATFQVAELGVPLRITEIMYNPPGGAAYEFVELQNTGGTTLDLSGVSLDGEVSFFFPNGASVPPGGVLVVSSDDDPAAFAARYPGVAVAGAFTGALSNGGGRLLLKDRNGQIIQSVDYNDDGGWPAAADGDGFSLELIDVNGDPDDPANWRASAQVSGAPGVAPTPPPGPGSVRINEVMADNVSAVPNNGIYPDWVELHNTGGIAADLSGWSLSDDGNPRSFVFPPGATLAAGGYLVVWCDGLTNAPGLHAPFALGRTGDSVFLYDTQTNRVDAMSYGLQIPDYSVGRGVTGAWMLTSPTPGAPNAEVALDAPSNLAVNEWMANARPGEDDWIELFNRSTNSPVALSGVYIGTSNALFQVRSLSFIASGGFVLFRADEQVGADHLDFRLSTTANGIRLFDPTGAAIDQIAYFTQAEGVSQGRLPDGTGGITGFPASSSPGASNYLLTYTGPVLNEFMARNNGSVRDASGQAADWIELFNPTPASFDVSGMSVSVGGAEPGQWSFPPGTQISANGYLLVWCDASRAPSTQLVANLNLGRALSGESGSVHLFAPSGQIADSVEYGFQLEDRTVGRSSSGWALLSAPTPGASNAPPAALGVATDLRLNEWMANPLEGDDWFELFNINTLPVSLSGLYLTDDPSIVGQTNFLIGPLSYIGGRSWVKWEADGDADRGRDHVSFQLAGLGETLRIYSGVSIVDTVDIDPQSPGVSQGRLPDGGTAIVFFPDTPTPDASNYLPLPDAMINELLSHTDPPLEDAVEIYNPTGAAADISGWYLSNNQTDLKRYRVPAGTVVPPAGYKVIYENQFNGGAGSVTPFAFNSAHGDTVYLSAVDATGEPTGYRAQARFGASANGVSFGRHVTSVGEAHFVAASRRTFGVDAPSTVAQFRTGGGAPNAYPQVGPVVISEIMYHPVTAVGTNLIENEAEEFIELRNISTAVVPLFDPAHTTNTWRLGGGVDFVFPANVSLPAGGALLLVNFDPTNTPAADAFRNKHSLSPALPLYGPYGGKLANDGESIELLKPDPPQTAPSPDAGFVPYVLVERITYSDVAPWPVAADGAGMSLQRISGADYGDDPANWIAAAPTPAAENQGQLTDRDADRMPDSWETANNLNPDWAGDAAQDADNDGQPNLSEYLSGTDPRDPESLLRIESVTDNGNGVSLTFRAAADRTYTVEYSDTVIGGWTRLIDVDPQTVPAALEVTDPSVTGTRYYRLVTPKTP